MEPIIADIASLATAIGVLVAACQLWLTRQQAVVAFEDRFSEQYRNLLRAIPVDALLGGELSDDVHETSLAAFYHYFDLCDEQAFLNEQRRLRHSTWKEWQQGIADNLRRPAFRRSWAQISTSAPESFNELRAVLKSTAI